MLHEIEVVEARSSIARPTLIVHSNQPYYSKFFQSTFNDLQLPTHELMNNISKSNVLAISRLGQATTAPVPES